jgi:hypothetical protein
MAQFQVYKTTSEVFKITSVNVDYDPVTYLVADLSGIPVNRLLYSFNLVAAEKNHNNHHRISRIISSKSDKSGQKQTRVQTDSGRELIVDPKELQRMKKQLFK